MKRIITLLAFSVAFTTMCYAQPKTNTSTRNTCPQQIENFISGLSTSQKKKIEQLHKEQKSEISKLRAEQRSVRDSIEKFNDMYGDYSKILYPLYEREAQLQIEISKHFYEKKVALDKILTREQHEEFVNKMEYLREHKQQMRKK